MTGSDVQSPRWCQWHDMGGDFLFDNGTCSGFEHLMSLSGGMVEVLLVNGEPRARHKFTRVALVPRDGAEIFSRGADPSSEQGWARGWLGPSIEVENWRMGECPRWMGPSGYRGRP